MDDDVLGGFDCKLLRVSGMIADSIMMGIVHSAMEQAFHKACSKEGVIERLNEKSRFCELAVMQLEWCLKFVQEETNSLIETTSCQSQRQILKLVSDLTQTRDQILRRLHETEFAISEKDKDFSHLQQAVNLLEAPTNRDGDFCELKNSVDQQFLNIKQKLEDERMHLTSPTGGAITSTSSQESTVDAADPDNQQQEDRENKYDDSLQNHFLGSRQLSAGFDKMGSDMDILKETLDVAFGMMSNAISLAEAGPTEQQWRWTLEKDIVALVSRSFLREIQQVISGEMKCGPELLSFAGENWSRLMDEIGSLRNELNQLVSLSEDQSNTGGTSRNSLASSPTKNATSRNSLASSPTKNATSRNSLASSPTKNISKEDEPSFTEESHVDRTTGKAYSKAEDQDHSEDPPEGTNPTAQGSLVAEMIRNHESIIRQKSEELNNWLKGEMLRERGSSAIKKDKGHDTMRKRIQDLVSRLDNVINGNVKLGRYYDSNGGASAHEVRQLSEEQEDTNIKTLIMDDIYLIVLKDLLKEMFSSFHDYDAMTETVEDVFKVFLRELVKEWQHTMSSYNIESHIREEMCYVVCSEAFKDAHGSFTLEECSVGRNEENTEASPSSSHFKNFENLVKEDVQNIVLRETVQDWRYFLERFKIESCIKEEVFRSAAEDTHKSSPTEFWTPKIDNKLQECLSSGHVEKLECTIRDDVYRTFFKEMVKDWNKEILSYNIELLNRNQEDAQTLLPSNNIPQCGLNDYLMRTMESLSNCFDVEENLILSASLGLVERNACVELSSVEYEPLVDQNIHRKGMLITNDKDSLGPIIKNLEMAMQHISMSKVEFNELRSCLDLAVGDLKDLNRGHNLRTFVEATVEYTEDSHYLVQNKKEVQRKAVAYLFSTFANVLKAIVDFEFMVHKKIGISVSRLQELKLQLDFCADHLTSIRKTESLYKKAFIRRCCNHQKAEAEVDLLADELDDILILLEKIYIALDHYSPVLQHYFGIKDLLKLIENELKRPAARTIVR